MFQDVDTLLKLCKINSQTVAEVMIDQEQSRTGVNKADIDKEMLVNINTMFSSIERGRQGVISHSGLTGGDSKRMKNYISNSNTLMGNIVSNAICNALAVNEVNAAMGLICATPTAGSAGVVPAALFALKDHLSLNQEDMLNFMYTAGAFGYIIANNASISGAEGGCQAEIGSASGMAAAAIVYLYNGTPEDSANACAIALKNMLGLVCDPVAGLVEIPCIKRNAAGVVNAFTAAELTLAGIKTRIPCDEVIEALNNVGKAIPFPLRETALGGLAATPTAQAYQKKLFGE